MKNCSIKIKHPKADGYYIGGLGDEYNVTVGDNKLIKNGVAVKL